MWSVYVLCCVLAAGAGVSASIDPHVLELKQHYEHVSYIAAFPCHVPQPKVFPVHQLFPAEQRHGKAYYPDITILHECGGTGSCTSGHHCVALHTEPVKLPFKITFLQDMEGHEKGSWLMEYHELLNHTECGCAPVPRETPVHEPTKSQSGYGGVLTPGSSGGVLQTGYGSQVPSEPQLGYGSSQLTSPGYGGSGTSYDSVGFRLGDSSGEDNNTASTSTTEAADIKSNLLNDTLVFKDDE